jgi:hypothetical protein
MTRRYLLAIVDGSGNVPPELHVARPLVERGHHVTVLAEDSVADEVLRLAPRCAAGRTRRIGRTGGPRTIRCVSWNQCHAILLPGSLERNSMLPRDATAIIHGTGRCDWRDSHTGIRSSSRNSPMTCLLFELGLDDAHIRCRRDNARHLESRGIE